MDDDVKASFKALETQANSHGEALGSISECTEEIKETVNGQAMAIQEVGHQRELCRAQMNQQVNNVAKAAGDADVKAELAHKRVSWLSKAAWGLVALALTQLLGLLVWLIKTAVAAAAGG